eukprot:Gb_31358 [translate_table: standard]
MTTVIMIEEGTKEHVNNATINPILFEEEASSEGGLGQFYNSKRGVKDVVDSGIDNVPLIFVQDPTCALNQLIVMIMIVIMMPISFRSWIWRDLMTCSVNPKFCNTLSTPVRLWVVNHGVPIDVMWSMIEVVHTFHQQPSEEKMKYET